MLKLRSIQVLRALAACAVVMLHAVPGTSEPVGNVGFGAAGVDLFFVISGVVMAKVAQGRSAGDFLRDRFWRIYPMWWIAVLPWLFLVPRGPTSVISSLTLWPIFPGGYYVPVLKVGWTLTFELLFYLGMTLAIARSAIIPLVLYAFFLVGALTTSSPLFHFVGSPMALEFLLGVAIAKLPKRAWFALFIPIGLTFFALTTPAIGDVDLSLAPYWGLRRALLWGPAAGLIVWGSLSIETIFRRRLFDVPVAIGDASYSIYLFHPLVAYGLSFSPAARLAIAIGAGWAIHLLIERRIMAAARRQRKEQLMAAVA